MGTSLSAPRHTLTFVVGLPEPMAQRHIEATDIPPAIRRS